MREKLDALWEASYPYVIGAFGILLARLIPNSIPLDLERAGINLPAFYSAVFNINIFGAGVMISTFVFTQAPAAGFIAKMEKLNIYKKFKRYLLESSFVGLLGGISCIPLASASPKALMSSPLSFFAVLAVGFSICFIFTSYRVSRIFLYWTSKN